MNSQPWIIWIFAHKLVVTLAFLALLVIAAAVIGLVAGWGLGVRVASGGSVREALRGSRAVRWVAAALGALVPPLRRAAPEYGFAAALGIVVTCAAGLVAAPLVYVETYGNAEIGHLSGPIQISK